MGCPAAGSGLAALVADKDFLALGHLLKRLAGFLEIFPQTGEKLHYLVGGEDLGQLAEYDLPALGASFAAGEIGPLLGEFLVDESFMVE